jgi:hypothetical protein
MSPKDLLKFAKDEQAAYVNVRFTDLVGAWHHLTFPIDELSESSFEDGFGFDGSSLRGWASIHESDMLLVPDPSRYWIDAFMGEKTLCLIADVIDPITTTCNSLSTPCATSRHDMARARRLCPSHSTATTAVGCTATNRFGKASNRFSPATVTQGYQRPPSSTSAGCSNTPLPSSPLPLLPQTVTSASCPALKPQLISPTRRATGQRQYVSPCSRLVQS